MNKSIYISPEVEVVKIQLKGIMTSAASGNWNVSFGNAATDNDTQYGVGLKGDDGLSSEPLDGPTWGD